MTMTLEIKNNQVFFNGEPLTIEEVKAVFQTAQEYTDFVQAMTSEGA